MSYKNSAHVIHAIEQQLVYSLEYRVIRHFPYKNHDYHGIFLVHPSRVIRFFPRLKSSQVHGANSMIYKY